MGCVIFTLGFCCFEQEKINGKFIIELLNEAFLLFVRSRLISQACTAVRKELSPGCCHFILQNAWQHLLILINEETAFRVVELHSHVSMREQF